MRHKNKTVKLGRTASHRDALLANQVISLIEHSRIQTTLAKAKAVRPFAEKMLTLGKKGTLHARRTALAYLRHNEAAVRKLFSEVAPRSATRNGGYTRIIKLGYRKSDAAPIALLEWVDQAGTETAATTSTTTTTMTVAKPVEAAPVAAAEAAPAAIVEEEAVVSHEEAPVSHEEAAPSHEEKAPE